VERHPHGRARIAIRGCVAGTLLAVVAATVLAGCGSTSNGQKRTLAEACRRGSAQLTQIGPVTSLADSTPALLRALALERAALVDVRRAVGNGDRLARQLEQAIASARLFLASVQGSYAEGTMSPLRTSVPGARRVVAMAHQLIRRLCDRA
jgi:hypothetical protein